MLIKGALAKKIIQRTGLGHAYDIKRHIDMAAEKKVISHDEARHLKKEYDRLYQGKSLPKHEVKELLDKLKDKNIKISGSYLRTTAANTQKVIDTSARLVHAEEREHIVADYNMRNEELEKLAHDKNETEEEKKKREEKEKKEALKGQLNLMKGGKSSQSSHHQGTPIAGRLGGNKAA